MTNRKQALIELRDKVKAGEWFPGLAQAAIGGVQAYHHARKAFEGSLDAAKAMHEAVLPGWSGEARMSGFGGGQAAVWNPMKRPGQDFRVDSQDPARAWLIAILEALIAQEDT